jgi:hypothetical protein
MQRWMTIFLCLALTSTAAVARAHKAGGPKGDRAALEKDLIDLEGKLIDVIVKGDVAAFQKMVSPDAFSTDGSGFVPTSEFAKMIPQFKVTSSKLTDTKVAWIDNRSAIVYYTWTGAGTMNGQPLPSPVLCSTIWTKREGRWVGVYHQESAAPTHK